MYETLDRLARKNKEREVLKSSLVRDGDDVEADLDVSFVADEPDFLDFKDIKACGNIIAHPTVVRDVHEFILPSASTAGEEH